MQHPQGLPEKIALAHNLVRYVDAQVVQYWTDTEAGSSDSPVFYDDWRVVALHHQWVESSVGDGHAYRNQGSCDRQGHRPDGRPRHRARRVRRDRNALDHGT